MLRIVRAWVVLAAVIVALPSACSDWPGLNDKEQNNTSGVPASEPGTCSGSPLPCSALGTNDCGSTPGCTDDGSCSGYPLTIGETCDGQPSPQSCNSNPGCYWSTDCTGTPYGTCSAITQQACLIAPGCTWTPANAAGAGGATSIGITTGVACNTYGQACGSSDECDCNFVCLLQCPTCGHVCGHPCTTDADCTTSTGYLGVATPHCSPGANLGPPYTGVCTT